MPGAKLEPFGDRVRRLREKRGWSQAELAEKAGLAPTALSRILKGDRDPRMGHLVELASALEISLTELVAGTTAAGAVLDWVPRERLGECERARVEMIRERDVARAEAAARTAEAESLGRTLVGLNARLESLEQQLAMTDVEIRAARQQREELVQLRHRAATLEAECARLTSHADGLSQALDASSGEAAQYRQRWEETCARSQQLQSDLSTAKGGQLVTAAMGLFLGSVLSPKGRS